MFAQLFADHLKLLVVDTYMWSDQGVYTNVFLKERVRRQSDYVCVFDAGQKCESGFAAGISRMLFHYEKHEWLEDRRESLRYHLHEANLRNAQQSASFNQVASVALTSDEVRHIQVR